MNTEPILVTCPACQASLPVPMAHLGKPIRCGQCNQVFDTPAPEADDNPFSIPSTVADRVDDPEPRSHGKDRSAEKKKPGLSTPVIIGAAVAGLLVLGGAALGIRYALQDKAPVKTAEATKKEKDQPKPKEKEKPKEKDLVIGADGRMADEVREKVKASTVYIRTLFAKKIAFGTGFFAAAPGLVVTNAHVIGKLDEKPEPVEEIQIVTNSGLPDSRSYRAAVLKVDKKLDLALLKVSIPVQPPVLEVIDAFSLKETQPVYIFGFPGGETIGTNISVNVSQISSIRRDQSVSWIQVAGGMHKGNSGGPVTDVYGRVVGVARATIRDTQLNMAIPGDSVHNFFNNAGDLIPKK